MQGEQEPATLEEARASLRLAATAERRALAESILDRRRRLLAENVEDPRRAQWLLDQAEDILLLTLPADGSDLMLLFGRPSEGQRRRALDLVTEALGCLGEADTLAQPRPSPLAIGDALESGHAEAARAALLRGVALVLRAHGLEARRAAGPSKDAAPPLDRGDREEALIALAPLGPELAPVARRLAAVHQALALAGIQRPEEALRLLQSVDAGGATEGPERLRVDLARIAVLRRAGDHRAAGRALAELVAARSSDLFERLLLADQQSLLQEELDGDAARAWLPYRALLSTTGVDQRDRLRQVLLDRTAALLAGARPSENGLEQLEPFAALALLLREGSVPARTSMETLLAREELPALERAIAALALGEALLVEERPRDAAEALLAAARRDRGQPEAIECAERAAELVTALWNADPSDADRRRLAAQTYDTVLGEFPELPRLPAWRLESARLALIDGRSADVQRLLAPVDPSSTWAPRAALLRLEADAATARLAVDPQRPTAWRGILEQAARLSPEEDDLRIALDLLRAEAMLEVGDSRAALDLLDGLVTDSDQRDAHAWRLVVEALIAVDRLDDLARRARDRADAGRASATIRVLTAMLARVEEECRRLEQLGAAADAAALGRSRMGPLAEATLAARQGLTPEESGARLAPGGLVETLAARGLLRSGRPAEALALVESVLARQPDHLDALLTKAESLALLGLGAGPDEAPNEAQLATAMDILKRVAAGRREARDRAFWLAETLQLEILLGLGRSIQQIPPRVAQLRRIDPALGGEGWRRRLEAAEATAVARR